MIWVFHWINSSCTLIAASYTLIKVCNSNFALYKSGSQFDFVMTTGWHPHPVVIFKTFDTRMTSPSGFQFDFVMRTGWHPHPVVKFFKYDNRMRVPSGSHNKIKIENRMMRIRFSFPKSENFSLRRRQCTKSQINYSNQ